MLEASMYSVLQSIHLSSVSIDLVLINYRTLDIQAHVVGDISVMSVWYKKKNDAIFGKLIV